MLLIHGWRRPRVCYIVKLGRLLLPISACLLGVILEDYRSGNRLLIKSNLDCQSGSVVICLWGVGWFYSKLPCLRSRFIFFPFSRLPQVLYLSSNLFLNPFCGV